MLRNALLTAFLVTIFCACNSSSSFLDQMRQMDTATMLTLSDALAIAQTEVPGGFAVEAELEIEDDDENEPPAYEVVFYVPADDQLVEVEVHAFTGEVLEVEDEDEGDDD